MPSDTLLRRLAASDPPRTHVTADTLVRFHDPDDERSLPVLVEPRAEVDLSAWATAHRDEIAAVLQRRGALLFRGFAVDTPAAFAAVAGAILGECLEYRERSTPRRTVAERIYTSTEYPASEAIFPHNENSYQHVWPLRVVFACLEPAASGGETPLVDVRRVATALDPTEARRFEEKQVLYVRNFGHGLGLPWQSVFQTTDRAAVEAYCRDAGTQAIWLPNDRLQTRQVRPAFAAHPVTGEWLWFNHATFFHVSTRDPMLRAALAELGDDEVPSNTFYGDGTAFEPDVLERLRQAYTAAEVCFPWRRGDVLLLDNMRIAHGRRPFTGTRCILVAMGDPTRHRQATREGR